MYSPKRHCIALVNAKVTIAVERLFNASDCKKSRVARPFTQPLRVKGLARQVSALARALIRSR